MVPYFDERVDSLAELLHFLDLFLQPLNMLIQVLQHLQNSDLILMS